MRRFLDRDGPAGRSIGRVYDDAELPRLLTTRDRLRLGISESALRHAIDRFGWQRLARGVVLTTREPPRREDWAGVGLVLAGESGAVTGWDAVRLVGVGPARPPTDEVLVLSRDGHHRRVGRVRVRPTQRPFGAWLLPGEHPYLPYARVTHPARAVADTALTLRRDDQVRALVTAAVQRRLCTPAELADELAGTPRRRSAALRAAMSDVLDGARSVAEAMTSDRLRLARVPAFELNVPLHAADGTEVARLDVLWRELRAALEVDSRQFHSEGADWDATLVRHNALNRVGLAVEHHAPRRIAAPGWGAGVERWLRARADELGVPYLPGDGPVRPGPHGPAPLRLTIDRATWRA